MKTDRKESLKQLSRDQKNLSEKVNRLKWEQRSLQSRNEEVSKALQLNERVLNTRFQTALRKLKDRRPDLFQITIEEQLGKLAVELTGSFIRYLIE
jgi:predicted nuclease with TOPRIM domain